MRLFRRDRSTTTTSQQTVAEATAPVDYDAQADLGLPTSQSADVVDSGFVPFAGELVPEHPPAAYDAGRDVGL